MNDADATGSLRGSVVDDKGEGLPGATVTLTGAVAPQLQVTDGEGQFTFLGLPPGSYSLTAELEGFSTVKDLPVSITSGHDTEMKVTLQPEVE